MPNDLFDLPTADAVCLEVDVLQRHLQAVEALGLDVDEASPAVDGRAKQQVRRVLGTIHRGAHALIRQIAYHVRHLTLGGSAVVAECHEVVDVEGGRIEFFTHFWHRNAMVSNDSSSPTWRRSMVSTTSTKSKRERWSSAPTLGAARPCTCLHQKGR